MIAEKVQIPRNMWDEYALCVNFDKESKQLEMALKFLQNAKSLSSLKKLMNSMTSSSGGSDLISKTTRVPMWLSTDQTLAEMEPLVAHRLLCFRRRFWFSDLNLDQADSKLLYFQFQEIKEHLRIMGSLIKSCSIGLADAAKLVVLLSKIDNHDKNTEEALLDSARELFPAHNAESLLQLINAKLRAGEYRFGDDERELQIKFITMTRHLSPFGETYFHAKDHNNNEVLLAVSRLCIAWYIDGILEEKFSIDRIRRWMAIPEKQLFQMEIDRGYSELYVLEWVTNESAEIQSLLDGYVQLTLRRNKRINNCGEEKAPSPPTQTKNQTDPPTHYKNKPIVVNERMI